MKKFISLFAIIFITAILGCFDDGGENELNPALLGLLGDNTLTVNVTYNGAYDLDGSQPGTGKIYVYLYSAATGLGTTTRSPEPVYTKSSTGAVTDTTVQEIILNFLKDGDYYVLVFYDYRSGDNADNKNDRYILYNNTPYTTSASTITLPGTDTLAITFDDSYILDSGSAFDIAP